MKKKTQQQTYPSVDRRCVTYTENFSLPWNPKPKSFWFGFFSSCFQSCILLHYKHTASPFSSPHIPYFSYHLWDLQKHVTQHAKTYLFHKSEYTTLQLHEYPHNRLFCEKANQIFQCILPKDSLSLFPCGPEAVRFAYPGVPSWTTASFKEARVRGQDTDISTDFRETGTCRNSWEIVTMGKNWNVGFKLSHSTCCLCLSTGIDLQKTRLH